MLPVAMSCFWLRTQLCLPSPDGAATATGATRRAMEVGAMSGAMAVAHHATAPAAGPRPHRRGIPPWAWPSGQEEGMPMEETAAVLLRGGLDWRKAVEEEERQAIRSTPHELGHGANVGQG